VEILGYPVAVVKESRGSRFQATERLERWRVGESPAANYTASISAARSIARRGSSEIMMDS
jgi:hypothetical protein